MDHRGADKAILIIDDFSGSLASDNLQGDVQPGQFHVKYQSAILSTKAARKRPNIVRNNDNALVTDNGSMSVYGFATTGPVNASPILQSQTTGSYLAVGSTATEVVATAQFASTNTQVTADADESLTGCSPSLLVTGYASFAPNVYWGGRSLASSGVNGNSLTDAQAGSMYAGSVLSWSGGVTPRYTTGTATFTTGSTTVTGSGTTWATSVEGCWVVNTTEAATARNCYRIIQRVSTTSVIIDRPYAGSSSGASKNYVICAVYPMLFTAGVCQLPASANTAYSHLAGRAWDRLLLCGSSQYNATSTTVKYLPNRVRWTGIYGSDEIEGAATGLVGEHALAATGYVDVSTDLGHPAQLVQQDGAQYLFCKNGIQVIYGAPTFDTTGSLDLSTKHYGYTFGANGAVSTPYGVAFYDHRTRGVYLMSGGAVRNISLGLVQKTLSTLAPFGGIAYFGDKLIVICSTSTASNTLLVYSFKTGAWAKHRPGISMAQMLPGISNSAEDHFVTINTGSFGSPSNTASYVWDFAPSLAEIEDGTYSETDGNTPNLLLTTGIYGDQSNQYRPYLARVTYLMTDAASYNPYLTLTISTGMDGEQKNFVTKQLPETGSGIVRTAEVRIGAMDRGRGVAVSIESSDGAAEVEIRRIEILCHVEREDL